jgi:hypothetical protein
MLYVYLASWALHVPKDRFQLIDTYSIIQLNIMHS